MWSGDIASTFDELALQIKVVQNVVMSGIGWWTTDIGGFEGANIDDPVWQQLIVRWFQFGASCALVFMQHIAEIASHRCLLPSVPPAWRPQPGRPRYVMRQLWRAKRGRPHLTCHIVLLMPCSNSCDDAI